MEMIKKYASIIENIGKKVPWNENNSNLFMKIY